MGAYHIQEILNKCRYIRNVVQNYEFKLFTSLRPDNHRKFLEDDPLAPLIATICDWKINADDAWSMPYDMYLWLKEQNLSFDVNTIVKLNNEKIKIFLKEYLKDKWPSLMKKKNRIEWIKYTSKWIVETCRYVAEDFGDVDQMFMLQQEGKFVILTPQLIYVTLTQLPGIGPKKAAMIARDFAMASKLGIYNPWFEGLRKRLRSRRLMLMFRDEYFSEVPVDIHVARVFIRMGLLGKKSPTSSENASNEEKLRRAIPEITPYVQNIARIIYPEVPGLTDLVLWDVGRTYCKPQNPRCTECPLNKICDYNQQSKHRRADKE